MFSSLLNQSQKANNFEDRDTMEFAEPAGGDKVQEAMHRFQTDQSDAAFDMAISSVSEMHDRKSLQSSRKPRDSFKVTARVDELLEDLNRDETEQI